MKFRFLVAAAIALTVFASCDKDDATTPANNPGTTKRLKKLTRTENGTTTVFNLTYNATNRLVSFKSSDNSEYVLFSYDAQGNLTGIEEKEPGFKNIYSYVYQNNIPVSGVFKSWQLEAGQPDELIEDDRLTYTVNNNRVTKIRLEMLQTNLETDLALTYTGDNLTRVVSTGQLPYTADFSFGTKRPIFPKVSNYVLDQAGFSLQFVSNNEMLTANIDFPGNAFDKNIVNQYTYDAAGYVLTSNDGDTRMVFEYQ